MKGEKETEMITTEMGYTDWAPETKQFILYDSRTLKPIAAAISGNATQIRKDPPLVDRIAQWQAEGAPLRCVAIVIVTSKGWCWTSYGGQLSWAAKNYCEDCEA
jgi:hypothetical protein